MGRRGPSIDREWLLEEWAALRPWRAGNGYCTWGAAAQRLGIHPDSMGKHMRDEAQRRHLHNLENAAAIRRGECSALDIAELYPIGHVRELADVPLPPDETIMKVWGDVRARRGTAAEAARELGVAATRLRSWLGYRARKARAAGQDDSPYRPLAGGTPIHRRGGTKPKADNNSYIPRPKSLQHA